MRSPWFPACFFAVALLGACASTQAPARPAPSSGAAPTEPTIEDTTGEQEPEPDTVPEVVGEPPPVTPKASGDDRDGDGIGDSSDRCPDEPEDRDGFEDEDGCPEPDNDRDGILDVNDKCTNEPETKNGFEDADGCPDKP